MNQPDQNDNNYDRCWKMRTLFFSAHDTYAKFYSPSEYLALDEITVLFKRTSIFKQYIPKKHKNFGIKIYKLCNMIGYSYNINVYLKKGQEKCNTDNDNYTCDSEKDD
jgi:hypothetical protein